MKVLRWMALLAAAAALWPAPLASAQEKKPQESLAEAARRARAQKQSAKPADRVWTNDNLPSGPGAVSVVGSAGEPAPRPSAPSGGEAPRAASPEEEEERAEAEKALKEEKARLERLKSELNVLQRDYDLARRQYYGDPGYSSKPAGQRELDAQQAAITAKQAEIAESEQKLAQLEEKLKEINERLGPKKEEPPTPAQQQGQWADRLRPLQDELAQVEGELQRMRAQIPTSPAPSDVGNNWARDRINTLERRRAELRQQISDIQDEARRAGAPPAWVRP